MLTSGSRAPSLSANSAQGALILVVERNPAVQRLERFLLEQAGYTVEFSNDGSAALERARQIKPKIIVTEILVSGIDGISLCRALKAEPETKSIVVLILSHLHAEDRALEAGADAFMIKPLNEERLIDTVARLLEIKRETAGG